LDGGGLGRPLDHRLLDRHGSTNASIDGAQPPAHVPCTHAMRLTCVASLALALAQLKPASRASRCRPLAQVQAASAQLAQTAAARSSRRRSLKPPPPLARSRRAAHSSRAANSLKPPPLSLKPPAPPLGALA